MDTVVKSAFTNFTAFQLNHLQAMPGHSPFTLLVDPSLWDWSQIVTPSTFQWKAGITPFADLTVPHLMIVDNSYSLDTLRRDDFHFEIFYE